MGRTGLFEVVPVGPEEAEVIGGREGTGSVESELRRHSRDGGHASLLANGIEQILSGETTVDEVLTATLDFA